jgi:hypothetical protein
MCRILHHPCPILHQSPVTLSNNSPAMNLVKQVLSFLDRYDELISQEKRIEQLMMTIVRISPHTASMDTRLVLFREAHWSHVAFLKLARP